MQVEVRLNAGRIRRHRHWTQSEVAKRSGLSKTTISNLESGRQKKIELETIARLCSTLDCTPNDLFDVSEKVDDEIKAQKKALKKYAGCLRYNTQFNVDDLDKTLADLI